ncbi:GAF and ANTAR domain-containing protein [Streptomyces ochraceiscleroticus]|uniref:ANTAR domain-containing protein n=1 Tax=Streptomyces ochraceiscleroticus TaxID=47761 RepID=A0ABW1MK13_9ACTN|nr:GAF and ANTAR domain-containing protein [Streptomyces ochraceiscleroticus]
MTKFVIEVMGRLLDESAEERLALQWVVERSAERLGARAAGALLADQANHLKVAAATSRSVLALQQLGAASGEGPGQACFRDGKPVLVPDFSAAKKKWPQYADKAGAVGIGAATSIPLHDRNSGRQLGVLSLFHARPRPMHEGQLAAALALADAVSLGLMRRWELQAVRRENGQLLRALSSRVVIEQAKGVLAERWQTDVSTAFDVLRKHARARQMRLAEAARAVVEGEPGADPLA